MITKNGSSSFEEPPNPQQRTSGVTMVPLAVDGPDSGKQPDDGFKIHPQQLWAAFCRHWVLAMTLGIVAGLPVAYLVFENVPTPFLAESEIVVLTSRPQVGFELPEDREHYHVIKAREMQRVKHPETMVSALDKEGIAKLWTLRQIPAEIEESRWLRDNISVRSSGEETFKISLQGEANQDLAKIVNAVTDAYLSDLKEERQSDSADRLKLIQDQLVILEEGIQEKQTRIKRLSAEVEGSSSSQQDLQRESDLLKMSELQAEIREIDREIIDLKSQLDAFTSSVDSGGVGDSNDEQQPAIAGVDPEILSELERAVKFDQKYLAQAARIKQLRRDIDRWKRLFSTDDLPEIIELKQALQEAEKQIGELQAALKVEYLQDYQLSVSQAEGIPVNSEGSRRKLEGQIQRLEDYRDRLTEEWTGLVDKDDDKIALGVDLAMLRDSLAQDQSFAENLKNKKSTLLIEKNAATRIELNYEAEVPSQRETAKRNLFASGAGLGTFGVVVALFTLLELRFMRVSSLKLLEGEFKFPILGTIPRLPVKVLQNQQSTRKAAIYQHTFMEAIDSARTVLLNQQKKTPMKTIMITSALGGEGKSTLSSHIAISFARAGRRTLLIDGDLRRPRVHDVFGVPDFPGFCETLRGETPAEKCIYDSGIPGLDIMPAGEVDSFTLRMLADVETQQLFARLRDKYDLVLFDSSPVLPVADSLLIMQSIDGVLLSIRKDHSRMAKVAAALKKIDLVGGVVLGGIVIGINEAEYGYRASYYGKDLTAEEVADEVE